MPTILSGALANKVLANMPTDHIPVDFTTSLQMGKGTLTVRLCSRTHSTGWDNWTQNTRTELTGGIHLTLRLPTPCYGNYKEFSTRLRPGYSEKSFRNAIHRLHDKAMDHMRLQVKRTQLYRIVEPIIELMDDIDVDQLISNAENANISIAWEDMQDNDIAYWYGIFGPMVARLT